MVGGFDDAPEQVRAGLTDGLRTRGCPYVGEVALGNGVSWFQIVTPMRWPASREAQAVIYRYADATSNGAASVRLNDAQFLGLAISDPCDVAKAVPHAFEISCDFLLLDGTGTSTHHGPNSKAPRISVF